MPGPASIFGHQDSPAWCPEQGWHCGASALTLRSQPEPMLPMKWGQLETHGRRHEGGACLSPFHGLLPEPGPAPHPQCSVSVGSQTPGWLEAAPQGPSRTSAAKIQLRSPVSTTHCTLCGLLTSLSCAPCRTARLVLFPYFCSWSRDCCGQRHVHIPQLLRPPTSSPSSALPSSCFLRH